MAGRMTVGLLVVALGGAVAPAQTPVGSAPPTPTTVGLGGLVIIGSGGNLGQDGGFTDALGTAGANPGWTLFTYGTAGGGGILRITAPSTNAATVYYWTAAPGAPNTSAAAANFDPSAPGQWRLISRAAASTASIQVTDANGSGTYLPLDNPADLATYNARLNSVFQFKADKWYDPNTNMPIMPGVGTFALTFADFSGGQYRAIDVAYTPVPEPTGVLGIAALGLAGVTWLRRRRRTRPD